MANEWSRPNSPPPPLFFGEKERNLIKQVNDELIENVIGQQILYYSIDLETTQFHEIYGEAIKKNFLPPVRIYALVEWSDYGTKYSNNIGLDKESNIKIGFHKRRLEGDQDIFVREGDYVLYGDIYYEITTLKEPTQLFGSSTHILEVAAIAKRARKGLFDAT